MTFDIGTVPTNANPFVSFCDMIELCRNRRDIHSFRLGLTRVQQSVLSEWRIQDDCQLSENVPFWSVPAHIVETSGWNNIIFGSYGDIGMAPCDLELLRGWGTLQQEDHLASNYKL